MEKLELSFPWAIIGRAPFKSLTEDLVRRNLDVKAALQTKGAAIASTEARVTFYNYSPVMIFFDGAGAPLYAIPAVPANWEATFAFETFLKAVPRTAQPVTKEEPTPPADAEEPAPEKTDEPPEEATPDAEKQ